MLVEVYRGTWYYSTLYTGLYGGQSRTYCSGIQYSTGVLVLQKSSTTDERLSDSDT
jgi:hypothetical protein